MWNYRLVQNPLEDLAPDEIEFCEVFYDEGTGEPYGFHIAALVADDRLHVDTLKHRIAEAFEKDILVYPDDFKKGS
jgi:hypothetical protein